MTRVELIKLGKKIANCEGTHKEIDAMYNQFNENIPYPDGANLLFYPENYDPENDDIFDYRPVVEEIVDKVLNYNPGNSPKPSVPRNKKSKT